MRPRLPTAASFPGRKSPACALRAGIIFPIVLLDPIFLIVREHFLSDEGDLESAALRLAQTNRKDISGLGGDLDAAVEMLRNVPWTALDAGRASPATAKTDSSLRRAFEADGQSSRRHMVRQPNFD